MLTIAYPQNLTFKMPLSAEYDYYIAPSSDRKKITEKIYKTRCFIYSVK